MKAYYQTNNFKTQPKMKEPRLEPDSPAHGVISYDARIAADTDVSASSYASTVSSVPVESLEVHDQPAKAQVPAPMTDSRFKAPFSRRKAAVVSSIITVLVILLTVVTLAILSREAKQPNPSSRLNLNSQDIQLKNQSNATAPAELQGVGSAVLINGDLITRGQLKVTSGAYVTVLRSANLTSNRNLTLPNASGTLCVDSNNCGYATTAQLQDLQSRLGQIVVPVVPDATTVNGQSGAVSVQGTSNQISVTTANGVIALSTPQDIAPISSPTFANLLLNGNFSVAGQVTLPLNCSGMLNGGALTTNASGQIICSGDDSASGGGGSAVTTAGGTAGNLALFTAADTIADSVISQALGAITIGGNTTINGTLSANSLTLATALSVANGGTGATTFTTNGVLVGNGTGAVTSTTAPTAGQLLLGNASNVPQFTTVSGDVTITAAGVTAIQADSVALGVDTTGNYVANLGTLTGLATSGNTGEGSTPTLSVVYGSTANTSVQGNTSISVTAGTNLTGGGSITLGSGGTVTLNVTNSPTFSGNVIAQGGSVTIGTTSVVGYTVLHDGNGQIGSLTMADLTAGRTYTFPDATGTVCLSTGNCVGGTGGAPNAATYLTIGNNGTLTNERSITAGNNISFTDGGANGTFTIDTVNNPNFSTSVTTPLLQSSGALSITPGGALTVGATGQTALLQGSTTTITSNGAGNDIVLTSADQITLTGFNCTTFANGGVLTTDASGNIICANDDGGAGGAIIGTGTANRLTLFTGSQTVADSWLLQNGSTLELDNTRNLSLLGGNFSVTGTGTFSGLLTANGNLTIESGDTFTMNGDAFTDLTGTGLVISSGSLQTTLGTSVDLGSEVTGTLSVSNGGTGVNGSAAANGQLLIGNGTGYTLATLTAGAGINITNASGGITVASAFGTEVDLGVETAGNYQAGTAAGNGISVSGTAGEGWTATVALGALTANWDQTGAFDIVLNNASSELRVLESAGGAYFGTIDVGDLTADRTYTFPDASGTICLSTGNCAGAGGGITGSGTTDTITKFTGTGTIGDSSISDDGSVVTLNGTANLVIQGGTATFGTTTQAGTLTISDGSSNTVSIVASAFGGNYTYTLPDVGGAATFCMSTGNCVGGGGGGAPNAAAYLVASLDGTLTSERALNAGSNISLTDGGAGGNFTVATVQNPTFTTSVTTPQLQSSGALTLVSAAGEVIAVDAGTTIELQDSTNVTGSLDVSVALNVGTGNAFQVNSSGAIAAATGITSSGTVTFSALNCTTFTNGGKLTTNASGQLTCANDNGAAAGTITGSGSNGTLPIFTATNVIADSIVTQSGTTVNIAGDLTLNTDLAVAQGGTGASSFTSNGVLYGNGTGALQVTAAGTSGQVLVANASGVPTFVSFSGDVSVAADGTTTIQANSVALGTDTTGNYIRNLGTLTGLTTTGNTGEAATPTLSVDYGSTANTAVQGNTQLTCASGTGNLSGGGTSITLGTGGTCGALNTVANPTFGTSVTTPQIQSSGALSITSLGALTVGSTAQAFTLQGNSSSTITATGGDGFVTTVGFSGVATGAVTYNFDRTAAPGTYTICTSVGNCSGAAVTLQTAYNASTNPEIVVDGTRGALTIRDNSTPIGANLLEVQNNAGTVTYLGVSATGASVTGNLSIAGTGASSAVALTVRGNGAQGGLDLLTEFLSYDGATTKSVLRVTNDAGLFMGNDSGTAGRIGISNGSYYGTVYSSLLTSSQIYQLPNASGTICVSSGNCGTTTGTLQNAYTYSVGTTTPEIKLDGTRNGIDIQDADTTLGASQNFMSFRAPNASGLGNVLVGFGLQGNLYMRPSTDRTDLLDINDAANGNLLTLDSTNMRLGFGLGGTATPNLSGNGIEMRGALKLSGVNSSANFDQNCMTPGGSPLPARLCIASDNDSVGFYGSIAQMGLTSGANTQTTASVLTLLDGRTVAHNLTLRVYSPDESNAVGFNWNGSNTTANVQTSERVSGTTSEMVLRSGNVTAGNGSSGVVYVQSGSIAGGTGGTTGNVVLQSGNALGTNVSSGNVLIDSGTRQAGTGTNGYVNIGATNASAVTISRTGVLTTVNGTLTVAQAATFNGGLTVAANQNIVMATGSGQLQFDTDGQVYIREQGSTDTDIMELSARVGYDFYIDTSNYVFGISQNGKTTVQAASDAFGGLEVLQTNGNHVFRVLTSGTEGEVRVGYASDLDPTLFILDNDTDQASDPTGVEGAMYYNNGLNKFRCYQNTSWVDCISPTGASTTLQQAYDFSSNPEITLDNTRGALTVRDNATPVTVNGGNLLEVQNNAGTTTYLSVASTGLTVNTALSAGAGGTGNSMTSNVSTTSGMVTGNRLDTALNPASNSSADVIGTSNTISTSGSANFSGDLIASLGQINWNGTGTSSDRLMGSVGKVVASGGSGAIQTAAGVMAEGQFQGGAVTNYYGLYSTMNSLNNVAIQNAYGLKIDNFAAIGSAAPTNFYAIAADGGMTRLTGSSAYQFQIQNAALTPVLNVDTTTTNLITNPSIEVDTSNWSASGGAAISRSASITPYDANFALRINTTAAAGDGARFSYNLAGSTQYTFSFFAKAAAGNGFGTLQAGRSDNGSTDTACTLNPDPSGFGGGVNDVYWKRYTCTFTTGAVSGSRYVYIKQTDATARTFYIDAVQLETGASATIYRSGKTALGGNLVVNGGQPEAGASDVTLKVNVLAGGHGLIIKASGANDLFKSLLDVRNADDTISYLNVNEVTRGTSIRGGNSAFSAAALEVTSIQDSAVALRVNAASGQTADIFQVYDAAGTPNKLFSVGMSSVTLGTNMDLLMQGASAFISNPQTQADAESFGLGSSVGSGGTALGNTASGGTNGVAIGYSTDAQGNAVAIGYNAGANSSGVAIGRDAYATTNSIALGRDAQTTASNQLVIGSEASGNQHISHVVIGDGVTSATPNGFTLQGTSGNGSNIAGASVNIAGGQGTGSAAGGAINLQVSVGGASGTGLNSLATVAAFGPTSVTLGHTTNTTAINLQSAGTTLVTSTATTVPVLEVQQTANSTANGHGLLVRGGTNPGAAAFEVRNSGNTPIFSVDTSNSRTTIGSGATCTGRLCVGQSSSGAAGGATTTNLYNIQNINISSGTPTYVGQNIVMNDTSTAQTTTLRPLVLDTTGSTNTAATINSIQAMIPANAAGTFLQFQNGSTDVLNVANNGATTHRLTTNSANAFQIQNAVGGTVFNIDTTTASTNLVTNASFETNTTGWTARTGTANMVRTTTHPLFGAAGMSFDTNVSDEGVNYPIQLSPSTQYTISFYSKNLTSTTSSFVMGYAANGSTETDSAPNGFLSGNLTSSTNGWNKHELTFTTGGSVSGAAYLFIKTTSGTARTFVIDGVQILASQQYAGAYRESSLSLHGTVINTPLQVQTANNTETALSIMSSEGMEVFNVNTTEKTVSVNTSSFDARFNVNTNGTMDAIRVTNSGTGSLLDLIDTSSGTNSVFTVADEGATTIKTSTNSVNAFRIQSATAAETLFTVDTTARNASGGNLIKIGNSTGTDTDLTILKLDSTTANPTSNLSALNGGLYYNSTTNKVMIIENGAVKELCNKVDTGCGAAGPSLGKDLAVADTSTSNFAGTMYTFTQQNTGAAGVLSLANAGTSSTLRVTSSGNASANNALVFGQLSNASISGNLLDLRSGASGSETSKFNVAASGATTVVGINGANGAAGTAAATVLSVTAGNGGTGSSLTGGVGGGIALQSGTGGTGSGGGGDGGTLNFTTGSGGNDNGLGAVGGHGGAVTIATGNGGGSSNGSGGWGGNITLQAGNGGAATGADGSGGTIILKPGAAGGALGSNGVVQIGSTTVDSSQYSLVLDSSTTFSDSGICSASVNPGALYFSNVAGSSTVSGTSAIRTCVPSTVAGGGWQDVVTSDALGALLFGVVPDSGANKGDVASLSTAGLTGPCKVSAVSATAVRVESCVAYTAGRRVTVNQNTSLTIPVTSGWTRICLTGTGLSVQATNNASETSMPSFMTPSLQLCLAHVKTNGTTITQVYDTRTFTTTQKEYYTVATAVSIGQVVTISGSSIAPTSATPGAGKILGVVVATDGSTSSTTAKALVATSGPAWVKATAGTAGDYVQNDSQAGYVNTTTTAPTANVYATMGIARTTFAGASCTATPNATNCNGSIYLVLNIR